MLPISGEEGDGPQAGVKANFVLAFGIHFVLSIGFHCVNALIRPPDSGSLTVIIVLINKLRKSKKKNDTGKTMRKY